MICHLYIIGHVPFLDLTIHVEKPILIPRLKLKNGLILSFKNYILMKKKSKPFSILELAQDALHSAVAQAFPQADVTAIDINPEALKLAQKNAKKNNINNVTFIESNLFENIQNQTFDIIISNPPYIAEHYKKNIDLSVKKWEDHGALFAPQEGLQLIQNIIEQLPQYLSDKKLPIKSAIECDPEQIDTMLSLCKKYNLIGTVHTDQFNKKRTVFITV